MNIPSALGVYLNLVLLRGLVFSGEPEQQKVLYDAL